MIVGMTAVTIAAYIFSKAIGTAIEQLANMVAIADKAAKVNVSPRFFQEFVLESEKLKVSAKDLEDALTHAFNAMKPPDLIDLSKWDFGTEKLSETEKILRVVKAEMKDFQGLELFRNAPDQEERIKAVLKAMQEMENKGKNIEAIQLGESFFGKKFADDLRRGETSVTKMLNTIEEARRSGVGIIPDELVKRAKEVDEQLKLAHNRLSKELNPLWSDMNKLIINIKNEWAAVVGWIAKALNLFNQFGVESKKKELALVEKAIAAGETSIRGETPMLTEAPETLPDRAARLRQELIDAGVTPTGSGRPQISVVKPPAAPAKPKPEPGGAETRDRLETSAAAIEKRTAALNAETGAIDLGTEARERAKIAAELETLAVQINTAAGEENTAVNEKQQATIDRVAEAWGKAAKAAEDAKGPLRTFMREGANVNKQLEEFAVKGLRGVEDALFDIVTGAATAEEAFKKLANAMIADLIRLSIRMAINNALMAVMNGLSGGAGGVISSGTGFVSANPPRFAEGGFLGAGKWGIAGENGPELIRGPAQVISNADSFGGGPSFNYAPMIDARGADVAAVAKLAQVVARDRVEFESRVKMIVRERPGKRW
jgi:hypothetical protein